MGIIYNMNIYVQDLGYRGSLTVVAENREQAIEFFKQKSIEYIDNGYIEEYPCQIGTFIENFGDR